MGEVDAYLAGDNLAGEEADLVRAAAFGGHLVGPTREAFDRLVPFARILCEAARFNEETLMKGDKP